MKPFSLVLLAAVFFAALLGAAQKPAPGVEGMPAGRVTGFQAPASTDPQGRRHVLKVADAQPLTNNIWSTTQPRVTSFNPDDTPEMFIEAPRCLYDRQANMAYSDSTLSVRRADGRFSIQGVGWRWDPSAAQLTISNQVSAFVERNAIQNLGAGATAIRGGNTAETNRPIRITSERFTQDGDSLSFFGQVLVQDDGDTLRCDRLNLEFVKPGGIQKMEALQHVQLDQGATHVASGRALYDVKENIVRFSDHPRWSTQNRQGSSDLLALNRSNDVATAEGHVYMKLPLTNVVAAISTNSSAPATNRFIEITSDHFRYLSARTNRTAEALYTRNVRALYAEGTITCERMTALFDQADRLERVIAEGTVVLENSGNKAFGTRADYEVPAEKITLTGEPHWILGERTGKSDRLIFLTGTKEILALRGVEMVLPRQSLGAVFQITNRVSSTTNGPMTITSQTFSHAENVSVFQGAVHAVDDQGSLGCDTLTVVSGASNRVERIVAEQHVIVKQPELAAFGERAEYNTDTGLVRLTGSPELLMPDKTLHANAFIINRRKNSFSVSPGRYHIELAAKDLKKETKSDGAPESH